MQRLNRVFSLEHSKTDLYLLDITKLCSPENSSSEVFHAHHVGSVKASWGNKDVITGKEHDKCVVKSPQSPFHFPRVSDSTTFNFRKFVSSRGKFVPESSHVDSSTRNASKPDVDKSEERFQVHDRTTDSVASDLGSSIGVPAIYRRQRGAPELRGHTDHEQHASGASESETGTPKFGGQSNVPRCGKTSGSTTCFPSTAAPAPSATTPSRTRQGTSSASQSALSATLVNRVLQDMQLAAPGSPGRSSWILAEEEEIEEMLIPEVARTRARPNSLRAPPSPPSTQVTLADWGTTVITWGKKHKGKSYQQVFQVDIGYYHWSLARFQSLPPNQQDFVRYCQVRLELEAQD